MLRLSKLKPLFHSTNPPLSSSPHQLLQRCSVSRTAKGKGKAGQILKRSKITVKKTGSEPKPGTPTGSREKQEKERLYKQCIDAPTPLRHLKPKQREREAEREKLGLISKERQREIDMTKKKNQKFRVSEKPSIVGTPGLDYITLGLVDVEKLPKYELTAEDGKRLAKEYSRVLMRKHRARQAAETKLLGLKKEAIEALPDKLKEAALVPDLSPFPVNRFMATLTPPIEGYIEKIREAANRISGKEKIR
ncbi:uncharacterized protein LOC131639276 [Vicia villosa]|uniref:uncharacterized protein LOC131616577 n=1 Tax=Vicia villosa TaxID=3911 RepID=UPI00273CC7AD|nr:uncharacterized protein LOC131616577 [Vicia villosa]XP_058743926.1 uncharacterized protein LOC131616577 [Vicia villosa]XP_058743927.1 uncharacterized protein LOC131616577 [Vicia villosa]XP_058765754.1 uncharacterized protein LOC131639276 [Vicia villosa]XP_058765755.1 uncharacterized protein LOC131639276 [Vicia villosa]